MSWLRAGCSVLICRWLVVGVHGSTCSWKSSSSLHAGTEPHYCEASAAFDGDPV